VARAQAAVADGGADVGVAVHVALGAVFHGLLLALWPDGRMKKRTTLPRRILAEPVEVGVVCLAAHPRHQLPSDKYQYSKYKTFVKPLSSFLALAISC